VCGGGTCGSELWLTQLVSGVPQRVQSPCQPCLGHLSIDRTSSLSLSFALP
jgi:hypothetical protein